MDATDMDEDAIIRGRHSEFVTGLVTGAAILLFVGLGSVVLGPIVGRMRGASTVVDQSLLCAMLLNIALILLGWRRYRALAGEIRHLSIATAQAHALAARDSLTGFLNRRSLAEEGAALFVNVQRRRKAMALLLLDLDHFKSVNDMHGHSVGDALLRLVASEVAGILPHGALAARLGGDEFAFGFSFDPERPEVPERIAETIVRRLSQPLTAEGIQLHLSASIGIARSDLDCPSVDALLRAADIAMYAAKNSGRNRHSWFDSSMERALRARNELETGLRAAIPAGQIVPYFEQQIDLSTGRLTGFEVLARWEHPSRGVITPDAFVPIAEETGMIADLTLSVLAQALTAARDWHPSLTLSVNVSPWQLKDAWLAQKVIKALTEANFPASRLEIEITESALFDNLPLAQSIVGSLKNQGVRLALDDFGTGYSSLAHLRALPFDRLKIDKSFVLSVLDNQESAAIVNAITRLADSLNLPCTAEGIETAAVEERLRALGCARGQGYHYGRAASAGSTRRLLAEKRLLANMTIPGPADQPQEITLRKAG